MSVYYPNNKLTKKQRVVLKVLDELEKKLDEEISRTIYSNAIDIKKIVKQLRVENGLEESYPTIREYMDKRHHFITYKFKLKGMKIKVQDVHEFADKYNPDLLDEYVVKESRRTFWSAFVGEKPVLKLTLERKRK